MMGLIVVFVGQAGCGKSLLTGAFGRWLEQRLDASVGYVNLDPGCSYIPYTPDFDVRKYFTVQKLMEKEGLGPNGAMIRASELMEELSGEIVGEIGRLSVDFTLVDTPGQMEIFVFRPSGTKIVKGLCALGPTVSVYIVDATLASSPSELIVALLLGVATQIRFESPAVTVVNKADLEVSTDIARLMTDYRYLRRMIRSQKGVFTDLALHCSSVLRKLAKASRAVLVSAKTGYGMEDLYTVVHEALCSCGDLT